MDIERALQQLGLSEKSISVYLAALELGETLLHPLAKQALVKRPTLYELLPELHQLGLIAYGHRGKRRTVIAQDPAKLLTIQEERLKDLRAMLPELLGRYNRAGRAPKVYSFEGATGIKQVYEDTLVEEFPIRSFLQPREVSQEIDEYLANSYMPRRAKKGIRIKNIVSGTSGVAEHLLVEKGFHRHNRYVDQKQFPADIELLIYGNRSAFVTYLKNSQPMGIIIESAEIAETLRSLHEIAWQKAEATSS